MNKTVAKVLEIIIFIAIIAISILIFVFREQLQDIGEFGYLGVMLLCFLGNATVLLPAPSLMIIVSASLVLNPFLVALFGAIGTTCGELVGYTFGSVSKNLFTKIQPFLEKITLKIKYQTLLVFILALLPLPLFDIVGIYSGGTKMKLGVFFLACFLGKFIKMLVYTQLYNIMEFSFSSLNWALGVLYGTK